MTGSAAPKKIESIQILRGLASVMILLFHYRAYFFPAGSWMHTFLGGRDIAIVVFFLISGFVIFHTTRDTTRPDKFLIRRYVRIAPLYYLIYAGLALKILFMGSHETSFPEILRSLFFIPLSLEDLPYLGHAAYVVGWTLNYEMFFYLLVAVSLLFGKRRYRVLAGLFILLHAVFIKTSGAGIWDSFDPNVPAGVGSPYLAMALNPLCLVFGAGIIVGFAFKKSRGLGKAWYAGAAVLFLLAAITVYLLWFPTVTYTPKSILLGLLLVMAFLSAEPFLDKGKVIRIVKKPLVWLGDVSYSTYLIHCLLLMQPFYKFQKGTIYPMWLLLAMIVAVLILSAISHRYIEIRFTGWLQKKLKI